MRPVRLILLFASVSMLASPMGLGEDQSGKGTTTQSPPNQADRQAKAVTYSGRTLEEWQALALTDLEPETRTKAFAAFRAFAANGKTAEALAAVRAGLEVEQPRAAIEAACEALVQIGPEANSLLLDALRNKEHQHRSVVMRVLSRGCFKATFAVEPLVQALADEDPEIRRLACAGLAHIALATEETADRKLFALPDSLTQQPSAEGYRPKFQLSPRPEKPGPTTERVVTALAKTLEDNDASVRIAAANALSDLGPMAKAAVPSLIAFTERAFRGIQEAIQENMRAAREGRPSSAQPKSDPRYSRSSELQAGLHVFTRIGPAASAAVPLLTEMKNGNELRGSTLFIDRALRAIQPAAQER